jgi:hypothetical protein
VRFTNDRALQLDLASQRCVPCRGDVIACGTSVCVGVMSKPENTVEISIDGIDTLTQAVPGATSPG